MSDEEENSLSEAFSASEDEWKPQKDGRGGESSDDDDSDFEDTPVAAGAATSTKGASNSRKRDQKSRTTSKPQTAAKKRKPMGQSLRTRLYNKYRPPPKTFPSPSSAAGSNSPSASTSRAASKNAQAPNESSDQRRNADDSNSDCSLDDYLVNPNDLDLQSSFFNRQAQAQTAASRSQSPPVPEFDCNAGLGNLSDSESDDNESSIDEGTTSKAFDFRNLLEKANSLERARESIAKRSEEKKKNEKKSDHSQLDVKSLLALGEGQNSKDSDNDDDDDHIQGPSKLSKTKSTRIKRHTKTRPLSSAALAGESDDSDWEEVADHQHDPSGSPHHRHHSIPTNLEIHVELPSRHTAKATKKQQDIELAMRRKMNHKIKEMQLLKHKTSLLCAFARGFFYNRLANNTVLMQAALRLLPSKNAYPPERGTEIKYYQSLMTWYKTAVKLQSPQFYPERWPQKRRKVRAALLQQIRRKEACCKQNFICIFVILLRGMGMQCRLVINLQTAPLRPAQADLLSLKLNPEPDKGKNVKGGEKGSGPKKEQENKTETKSKKETIDRKNESKPKGKEKAKAAEKLPVTVEMEKPAPAPSVKSHSHKHVTFMDSKELKATEQENTETKPTRQKPGEAPKLHLNKLKTSQLEATVDQGGKAKAFKFTPVALRTRHAREHHKEVKENVAERGEAIAKKVKPAPTSPGEGRGRKRAAPPVSEEQRPDDTNVPKKPKDREPKKTEKIDSIQGQSDAATGESQTSRNKAGDQRQKETATVAAVVEFTPVARRTRHRGAHKDDPPKVVVVEDDSKENVKEVEVVAAPPHGPTDDKKVIDGKETSGTTTTRARSRTRSKSPRAVISTAFLQPRNRPETEEIVAKKSKPVRDAERPKRKVKVSTAFLNPLPTKDETRLQAPASVITLVTEEKTSNLKIPQIDGADDIGTSGNPPAKKKRTNLKKTKPRGLEDESDDDFEPSPPKRPKVAPRLPKQVQRLRADRRVLSTDDDEAGGNAGDEESPKSKRNPTAADMWIEVWSDVEGRWICLDLFKGKLDSVESIRKSASSSSLAYVYAFQNDMSIKDVTARYCLNWATIIRKSRVEKAWLEEAISQHYGHRKESDIREDHELRQIHESKPLPTTISDFKNHPLYALERHLLKFEGIYPPDAPSLGFIRGEPIYPRDCVHTLHSREIWLKQARTVRLGEQPYKVVKARPKWDRVNQTVIKDQPLEIFGYWQTQDYEPPTAENGIVPRNAYGNVELFKECMLPKKTAHIRLPGLNRVCKKLGIDCANAVIGFDFHQGMCHPMLDGFVICEEFVETVTAAWHEEQENLDRKDREKREQRIYGNWKKLIRGLLIRERLKKKYNL